MSLQLLRGQPSFSQGSSPPSTSAAALGLPPVLEWQAPEVASFLTSLKCGHLAPVFEANDITGDVILELDLTHLKEMGVSRVGDRVRLLAGLKALKASTLVASTPRQSVSSRGSPSVSLFHSGSDGSVTRGPTPTTSRSEGGSRPVEPLRACLPLSHSALRDSAH